MDMEKEHHHHNNHNNNNNNNNNNSWYSLLPEGCISTIISFTSPKDASRFSILSPSFKSAADSDTVWERFLPSDYEEIIGRCVSPLTLTTSKKQLYFLLCDYPILLDDGNLSMNLVKATGKKCFMISSREVEITWGNTPRYWNWISILSRFAEVAELLAVCWLEIRGKIRAEMLSLNTMYGAYLVFRFKQGNVGLDEACKAFIRISGNDEARIELSEVNAEARVVYLQVPSRESRTRRGVCGRRLLEPLPSGVFARERGDGWMELKLGEFLNNGEGVEEDAKSIVEMLFWDSESFNWKHGLVVEGIEFRPL